MSNVVFQGLKFWTHIECMPVSQLNLVVSPMWVLATWAT